MRPVRFLALCSLFLFSIALFAQSSGSQWKLTWSDEFNAPDGTAPDATKWNYATGGNGWGNNELEYYTARKDNAVQEGGNLVITARKEHYTGPDGVARDYTSARLLTKGKFGVKYGRVEARIKIPIGQGLWPAFWMVGDNVDEVGWPKCGEIDIMEAIGSKPNVNGGSLHGPGYSGAHPLTAQYTLPAGTFHDDFHTFAIEWEPEAIRFYVDDHLYETRTSKDIPPGTVWAYDHPFHIILNVAIGGNLPKNPDATTEFPQKMYVDWVRVYQKQ